MNVRIQKQPTHTQPATVWLLKTMLLILGISALLPGIELMRDPSGTGMGFPEGYLTGAPFPDYFIPGLLLTVFIGSLSLLAWWALWKKPRSAFFQRINPFTQIYWGWTLSLISGIGLITWIVVQMIMVPYFFLQPLFLGWGIAIVLLCITPATRSYYALPILNRKVAE